MTDIGLGVLADLKRNPSFSAIATDIAALQNVVRDGVSCTGKAGRALVSPRSSRRSPIARARSDSGLWVRSLVGKAFRLLLNGLN